MKTMIITTLFLALTGCALSELPPTPLGWEPLPECIDCAGRRATPPGQSFSCVVGSTTIIIRGWREGDPNPCDAFPYEPPEQTWSV